MNNFQPQIEDVYKAIGIVMEWRARMEPLGFVTPSMDHTMDFLGEEAGEVCGVRPRQSDEYLRRNEKSVEEENEVIDWIMMAATAIALADAPKNKVTVCLSEKLSISAYLMKVTAEAIYEHEHGFDPTVHLLLGIQRGLAYLNGDALEKIEARLDEREQKVIRKKG